jgi:hypothetical protein
MASQLSDIRAQMGEQTSSVNLPAPTPWPIVLALGLTLLFAGLVTSVAISILGAVLSVCGCVGWFREVLPYERHESVPVVPESVQVVTRHPMVARVEWMSQDLHRARLPLEIYPVSAGVKGGLAGSVVMAALAVIYGIVSRHGIWYPINLLSAGFFPARVTTEQLSAFHWDGLIIASAVHLVTSLLVGLLYGATLPMFPRRPILLGGLIGPILWSALIHSFLEVVNPTLNLRIDWTWFVICQVGFGVVAGTVVLRHHRVRTWQHLPFGVRAGIETPGAMDERNSEEGHQ